MKGIVILLVVIMSTCYKAAFAQTEKVKVPNVAVFAPLYLDSSFGDKGYKHGKLVAPFAVAGVEYYYGAKKAMDSINADGNFVHYYIFDSKSSIKPIATLIDNEELAQMDMLIGSVSGTDVKLLADYALQKNIPFISATFPNDAGVKQNPNFAILNSTLGTLCEKLHGFIADKISEQKIIFFSKEGKQEERIQQFFKQQDSIKNYTNIEYINLGKDFSDEAIFKYIDTSELATYIIGSNDVLLAKAVSQTLAKHKLKEKSYMMGLATWDHYYDLEHKDFNGIYYYYVSPLGTPSGSSVATNLGNAFKKKYDAKPGDNVYRGFESVYKYTKLLLKYGKEGLAKDIANPTYNTIHNYDLKPIKLPNSTSTDFFENKKVHIVKIYNGERSTLNY